mmetsp:Transcript_16499/g.39438  ORF Transcript_16499/g.39438 Transcript_16499/m.39438 type:complete len:1357 (+) Transcript_16499:109-4179(+)
MCKQEGMKNREATESAVRGVSTPEGTLKTVQGNEPQIAGAQEQSESVAMVKTVSSETEHDVEPLGSLYVIVIDSKVEHQRRTPWSGWGEFPLLPVGDPNEFSQTCSTVAGHFYGGGVDSTTASQEAASEGGETNSIKQEEEPANCDIPDTDEGTTLNQPDAKDSRERHSDVPLQAAIEANGSSESSTSSVPAQNHSNRELTLIPRDATPAFASSQSLELPHDRLQSSTLGGLIIGGLSRFVWLVGRMMQLGISGPAVLFGVTPPRFQLLEYAVSAASRLSSGSAAQEAPERNAEPQLAADLAPFQEAGKSQEASEVAAAPTPSEETAAISPPDAAALATSAPRALTQPQAAPLRAFPPLDTSALAASPLVEFVNPPVSPGNASSEPPASPGTCSRSSEEKTAPESPLQNWVDSAHRMLMKVITHDQHRVSPPKQRPSQAARLGKAEPSSIEETRWALGLLQSKPDHSWVVEEGASDEDSASRGGAASDEQALVAKRRGKAGGWFYSTAFPSPSLVALGASEESVDIREEEHSYAMVRWRRWLRKRTVKVPPRVVEELRWTGGHPGTVLGGVGGVSDGWLSVMNLSVHRIVGCVYVPAGENIWHVRRGEVKGLGLGATWMVPARELQGRGALIALARQEASLPVVLTAATVKGLCVVKPEAVFKRLFITIAAPDSAMPSLVTAAGADHVVAMDTIQRDILLPSSHQDIQRLQYQAEHPEQRWREEARVSEEGGMCAEEAELLAVRKAKVREALEKLLGEPVAPEHVPTIALCLSGGGVRAMIASLGALLAAEELGVLDCCSYTSALSGGAWLQGCWMEAEGSNRDVLDRLAAFLPEACSQHPLFTAGRSIASDPSSRADRRGSSGSWSAGSAGSDGEESSQIFRWDSFSFGDSAKNLKEAKSEEVGPHGPGSDGTGSAPPMADPWSWGALWQPSQRKVEAKDSLAYTLGEWYKWSSSPSLVELYGFTVANAWLLPRPNDDAPRLGRGLSSQRSTLASGSRPLPIYTAVRLQDEAEEGGAGAEGGEGDEYEWVEFTPMTFASCRSGRSVPVWALGRSFHQGRSVSCGPELPLPILFGMWGAAFTASPREVLRALRLKRKNEAQRPEHVAAAIAEHVLALAEHAVALGAEESSARLRRMRIVDPYQCPSPFAGLEGPVSRGSSPGVSEERASSEGARGKARSKDTLVLSDAGINFNVPVPPLLRPERGVDVMVMVDARAFASEESVDESHELTCAAQYARDHGFSFPKLPASKLKGMGARPCTVFGGEESDEGGRKRARRKHAPMVVYLPLVKNEAVDPLLDPVNDDWASFYEFQYEPKNFKRLLRLARENVLTSKQLLLDAIRRAVQIKREETVKAAA